MAISFNEAEHIMKDPRSEFHKITETIHLQLPPKYLGGGRVNSGILEIMNSKRRFFSHIMDGALIAFNNVKMLDSRGSILDEAPYINFDIRADFIVFRPVVGCLLKGVVNKLGKNHIGCLVHQCFNASIPKPRELTKNWLGGGLAKNDQVILQVTEVSCNNDVLSMKGTISEVLHQEGSNRKTEHNIAEQQTPKGNSDSVDDKSELPILSTVSSSAKKKRKRTLSHENEETESANKKSPRSQKTSSCLSLEAHEKRFSESLESSTDLELSQQSMNSESLTPVKKKKRRDKYNKSNNLIDSSQTQETSSSEFTKIKHKKLKLPKKGSSAENQFSQKSAVEASVNFIPFNVIVSQPEQSELSQQTLNCDELPSVKKKKRRNRNSNNISQESSLLSPDQMSEKQNSDSFSESLLKSPPTQGTSTSEIVRMESKKNTKKLSTEIFLKHGSSAVVTDVNVPVNHVILKPKHKKSKHEKQGKRKLDDSFSSKSYESSQTEGSYDSTFSAIKPKKRRSETEDYSVSSMTDSISAVDSSSQYIPLIPVSSRSKKKKHKKQKK